MFSYISCNNNMCKCVLFVGVAFHFLCVLLVFNVFFFNDVCLSFFGLSCLLGVHVFVLDICGVCVRVL